MEGRGKEHTVLHCIIKSVFNRHPTPLGHSKKTFCIEESIVRDYICLYRTSNYMPWHTLYVVYFYWNKLYIYNIGFLLCFLSTIVEACCRPEFFFSIFISSPFLPLSLFKWHVTLKNMLYQAQYFQISEYRYPHMFYVLLRIYTVF